jgi:hypothetical protein
MFHKPGEARFPFPSEARFILLVEKLCASPMFKSKFGLLRNKCAVFAGAPILKVYRCSRSIALYREAT